MMQSGTPEDDGASFVSQCPIIPNKFFDYDFSTGGQTGTYWYHSHDQLQYCDGLRGGLIIYDPEDPHRQLYDVDNGKLDVTHVCACN